MNTTVIMAAAEDFGAGKDRRVEFRGCRWKVDDLGALHVYSTGQVAAFAPGAWLAVTDGSITESGVKVGAVQR